MNMGVDTHEYPGSWLRKCSQLFNTTRVVLALLLIFCLFLATHTLYRMSLQSDIEMMRVIINGDTEFLDAEAQEQLRAGFQTRIAGFEHDIDQQVLSWKEDSLAEIEANFQNASEQYLDWYFSLIGSYTRLGVAVLGDMEPWMETQLEQRLIQVSGLESSLVELSEKYSTRLIKAEQVWLNETRASLQSSYTPSAEILDEDEINQLKTINLDRLLESVWQDQTRLSITHGVPLGTLSTYLIARKLANTAPMKASRVLVTRFAARLGVHAARSVVIGGITGGVSGLAAPITVPLAIGSSLAISAGSEFAALKIQEAHQRPQMEDEMLNAWNEIELEVSQRLQSENQARAEAIRNHMESGAAKEVQASELPKTYRILGAMHNSALRHFSSPEQTGSRSKTAWLNSITLGAQPLLV